MRKTVGFAAIIAFVIVGLGALQRRQSSAFLSPEEKQSLRDGIAMHGDLDPDTSFYNEDRGGIRSSIEKQKKEESERRKIALSQQGLTDHDRAKRARELGLPETAGWADIVFEEAALSRKKIARDLGLPETAAWDDIYAVRRGGNEKKGRAHEPSIPESWVRQDVADIDAESLRKERALALGLPETAAWSDICDVPGGSPQLNKFAVGAGLPETATCKDIAVVLGRLSRQQRAYELRLWQVRQTQEEYRAP